ncbi:MAG TPA: class I SAM-dependent methyltransferase [Methanoregulaceae archaeon]|nr:class I SAM-dependent methyltransferase [Methanoregulaceae archaeon]
MPGNEHIPPESRLYMPSMTREYSRISDTARAVDLFVVPGILSYLESVRQTLAGMPVGAPFVIADYGAADGANSSQLFESVIRYVREINPSLGIKLVYIDIADPSSFDRFWEGLSLSELHDVEAEFIQRSFYEPFPELAGVVQIGFSSTALHWLDTKTADADLFRHPTCIQANQLAEAGRGKFVEKWKRDWRIFFRERSRELVGGGLLFLANLTSLGGDRWPASAGYDNLRDVCYLLYREGRISKEELQAIFIPDYFATPDEMRDLIDEDAVRRHFSLKFFDAMTVPCAYFSRMYDTLEDARERRQLADLLARVVRAWSESSIRVGLSPEHAGLVDEIYSRLAERFFEIPRGLPYQYCLIELVRANGTPR